MKTHFLRLDIGSRCILWSRSSYAEARSARGKVSNDDIYGHRRQSAMRSRPEKSSSITITGRLSGLKAPRLASPSARDQAVS